MIALYIPQKPAKSAIYCHYPAYPATERKISPTMHLVPYVPLLLTASTVHLPLRPRVEPYVGNVEDIETVELDANAADGSAGAGVGFASPFSYSINCNAADTKVAKKEFVAGRTGTM